MSAPLKGVVTFFALALAALSAEASFQAAELIYVPAVAQTEGALNSEWRTDLTVTNVDDVAIDVAMVYLPSGLFSNAGRFVDRTTWLGGREDEGFGYVDERLADIAPNGTVVLRDVVGEYWLEQSGLNGLGAMVVFAYEAGTLQDDGSSVPALAVANARIFNQTLIWRPDPDSHGFIELPASYGQTMPGVAWYNLADPAAVSEDADFSFMVVSGGEETPDYRFNLGVLNGSDPQTTITISIQAFQPDGEPYVNDDGNPLIAVQVVPPLAHLQWFRVFSSLWGLQVAESSMIKVSFLGWASTSPDPVPAFITYGSMIDEASNDPATIMGSFAYPFNVECMFPDQGGEGAAAMTTPRTSKPVDMPPR